MNKNPNTEHSSVEKNPEKSENTSATWGHALAIRITNIAKEKSLLLKRKVDAIFQDVRQRLSEPALTREETTLLSQYQKVAKHLPRNHLKDHPPLPSENWFNRREIRQFLASPNLPDLIEQGRAAAAAAEEARIKREAAEQALKEELEARDAADRVERLEAAISEIDKFYANTLNEVRITISQLRSIIPESAISQAGDLALHGSRSNMDKAWLNKEPDSFADLGGQMLYKAVRKGSASGAIEGSSFQRSLVSMTEPERAALRLADILHAVGAISSSDVTKARTPIVWNKGECLISIEGSYANSLRKREAAIQALKSLISTYFGEPATGTESIKARLAHIMKPDGEHPTVQRVLERYIVGGSRWMTPSETVPFLPNGASSMTALRLGQFADDGSEFLYDMNESLITIAAPGTGKSQGHVLRNLLYMAAPAVVLDVKGEMLHHSAKWRHESVGPVSTFAPATPATSISYNPLDFISENSETAWDEARKLADLLVVPTHQSGGDTYFEDRSRDVITTAILDVALSEQNEKRNMIAVLDRLYMSDDELIAEWCEHLASLEVPQLRRQASALRGMPSKQREGILDTARRQLEIWQSPAIERLTRSTNFSASSLRQQSGTLYLCVALEDIKKYASVLRVMIGQTLQVLCRAPVENNSQTVTFFLDELPRLGRMDVIEEALDIGRGFGVRLWMFCQNTGQLETAYPNAAGMIKSCAIRAYMNPDEQTAHQISQNLGTRETLLDAARRPLAEPSQLAGPDFRDKVIVFARSSHAAQLKKVFAYSDPVTKARMSND